MPIFFALFTRTAPVRSICLALALGVWAALPAWSPFAMGAEAAAGRRQQPQPAFKTERGSRPGDWGRYDRTVESFGRAQRSSVLAATLANDGKKVTSRATMTDKATGKQQSGEFAGDIGDTIESTLFSDVALSAGGKIKRGAPVRETVVVAGHAFDCVVLSATESNRGVVTEAKVWYSPDAPFLGMVKKETVSKAMRGKKELLSVTYRTELREWGDASRPPAP